MGDPSAPTIFPRPKCTDQKIQLYWGPPATPSGAYDEYHIVESNIPFSGYTDSSTFTLLVDLDPPLTNGSNYTFRIEASQSKAPVGGQATFRTVQPGFLPDPPTNVSISTITENRFKVSWTNPAYTGEASLIYNLVTSHAQASTLSNEYFTTYGTQSNRTFEIPGGGDFQFVVNSINDPGYSQKAYTSTVNIPFYPYQLSNIQYWIDARATSTLTLSASTVTAWLDKSKYQFSTSALTGTLNYNFEDTSVVFDGASYFTLPDNVLPSGNSPYTYYAVVETAVSQQRAIIGGGDVTSNSATEIGITPYRQLYTPWLANDIASTRILPEKHTVFVGSLYSATTSNRTQYVNGMGNSSDVSAYVRVQPPTNNTLGIATGFSPWYGTMKEVLVYSNVLTQSQRYRVEGYLAWKWGLQTSLEYSHPYKFINPLAPFNGISTLQKLQLWYDFADSNSVVYSGASISYLQDKSLNGFDTNSVFGTPIYNSTLSSITFTSSDSFSLPNNTLPSGNSSYSYFIVCTPSTLQGKQGLIGGGDPSGSNTYFGLQVLSNGNLQDIWDPASVQSSACLQSTNLSVVESIYSTEVSTASLYLNFHNDAKQFHANHAQPSSNNTLGVAYGSNYFIGNIHEVIVFSNALTKYERNTVEGYLAWKWGLQANLPGNHPYRQVDPTGTYSNGIPFTPSNTNNCTLWYDIADSNSYTFITNGDNSKSITQIFDKSGNGNHTTGVFGTTLYPLYFADQLGLYFDRAQVNYYTLPDHCLGSGDSSYTFILAFRTDINSLQDLLFGGTAGIDNSTNTLTLVNTTALNVWTNNDASGALEAFGQPQILTARYKSGGKRDFFINGNGTYVDTPGTRTQSSSNNSLGFGLFGSAYTFQGWLYELLVFSNAIPDQQREDIEAYLMYKWNSQQWIRSKSYYFNQPPTTPLYSMTFTPKSVPGLGVWFDTMDRATLTFAANGTNAGSVSRILDKSGYNRHFVQVGGNISYYRTQTIQSNAAIDFTHGGFLASSNWNLHTDRKFSVFVVTSVQGTQAFYPRLVQAVEGFNYGSIIQRPYSLIVEGCAGNNDPDTGVTSVTLEGFNKPAILSYIFGTEELSADQDLIFLNGVSSIVRSGNTGPLGSNGIFVGNTPGNEFYPGNIAELLWYPGNISQSNRQVVEGYLAWKWGLQANLSSNHPFYNAPPS